MTERPALVRRRKVCRTTSLLDHWVERGPGTPLPDRLARHLRGCPRCFAEASAVLRIQDALMDLNRRCASSDAVRACEQAARRLALRSSSRPRVATCP